MDRPPLTRADIVSCRLVDGPVGLPGSSDDPTLLPLVPDPERSPRDDRDDETERLAALSAGSPLRCEASGAWATHSPRRVDWLSVLCALVATILVAYCLAWWTTAGRDLVRRHDRFAREIHVR